MTRLRATFSSSTISSSATPLLIVAVAAVALAVVACDSGTQEPAAPTPPAPEATQAAPPSDESAAAPPAAGAREGKIDSSRFPTELPEGATAAIPDNFPSDVPIYPGAQPALGKGIDVNGSPQTALQLLSNDAYSTVHKFYSDQLQGSGWTLGEDTDTGDSATIQASKDNCKATILIMPVEGGGSDIFVATEC